MGPSSPRHSSARQPTSSSLLRAIQKLRRVAFLLLLLFRNILLQSSSWMTESPESESEIETTTENRRRRGYVKKRVNPDKRTTETPGNIKSEFNFFFFINLNLFLDAISDIERNSLEDVLFNDQENVLESDIYEGKFIVVLRLSPRPEQLVKGYEFKMLNK